MQDFYEENRERLEAFSRLSQTAGRRADYVQGGGGNTSVKLRDGSMAIKASGFCLSDITPRSAYAVLDGSAVRNFYMTHGPEQFSDVEAAGSAVVKQSLLQIAGMEPLRPSVETGFHSILKTYVLHTHSVYANLAACSADCREIARQAFRGADYTWGMVTYADPGARLTFAIRQELQRVTALTGRTPSVILMQNHGIIVHDEDPDRCLALHEDANRRLAAQFGITPDSFPEVKLRAVGEGLWALDCPRVSRALKEGGFTEQFLLEQPLYPEQMVFLIGTFSMDAPSVEAEQCVADSHTGQVLMRMNRKKAQVLGETLAAIIFLLSHIRDSGHPLSTLGEDAQHFIANWESEKYRKSLAGRKG